MDRLSQGPASVTELATSFDITLTAVVQHVRVLERCGLVISRKVGRVRTCHLDPAGLAIAEDWIAQRRRNWERKLDRLGKHLVPDSAADNGTQERCASQASPTEPLSSNASTR